MRRPRIDRRTVHIAIWLAVGLAVLLGRGLREGFDLGSLFGKPPPAGSVESLFADRRSDVVVEFEGLVTRTLSDDREGSRHQRFIVELASGHTVLVAHNIDLAHRVPLARGDRVAVRGEYEWNDRGGVVHWTHHDPQGRRPGGWVRHEGTDYR